ncbi:hypothetical protein D9619_006814 [Psilocybe cf. subviscida]|uniref:Yeast cell wall synthesis Kre9/Knh1-like N-terminal domain-containing protein n=1 Tax=Psilocybe cf. subviscida TaxID=2480587 RepID=A0A8H5B457_9AGAR|nr:hypothetical protein D9619_006814 [Psilocybe cf. subviscida]
MFSRNVFTALLALSAPLSAFADVTPSEPGPGDVFNVGQPCNIVWTGDRPDSGVSWKNMAIELMTGDNFNMVHITTVATGQDGSVDGKFSYTCPEVTPNSAIYFYQFTAPGAINATWTTRFTLASATGATTPPANANQPGAGGAAIPWGVGALVDPSKAVAAPIRGAAPAGSVTPSGSGSANATVAPSTPVAAPTTLIGSSTKLLTTPSSTPKSTAATSSGAATPTSGAGMLSVDARIGLGAVAFLAAVLL